MLLGKKYFSVEIGEQEDFQELELKGKVRFFKKNCRRFKKFQNVTKIFFKIYLQIQNS